MNVVYLFTFFLVVLIALFLLLPFVRQDKSTFTTNTNFTKPVDQTSPEEIALDLGRDEAGAEELPSEHALTEFELEIEVAVKRARLHKSTFRHCPGCGHQLQLNDRFCASCGQSLQSS
jgi:hypothetical protein